MLGGVRNPWNEIKIEFHENADKINLKIDLIALKICNRKQKHRNWLQFNENQQYVLNRAADSKNKQNSIKKFL